MRLIIAVDNCFVIGACYVFCSDLTENILRFYEKDQMVNAAYVYNGCLFYKSKRIHNYAVWTKF